MHQHAAVHGLRARRHVERRVLHKDVDGPQRHAQRLAGHDGKVLGARHVVEPKLQPHDGVAGRQRVLPRGPRADAAVGVARVAAALVGPGAAGVELAVGVAGDVDGVVGELGAAAVEGVGVGQDGLHGGQVHLVGGGQAVDGVAHGRVGDVDDAARGGGVDVERAAGRERRGGDGVADAVGVEPRVARQRHRVLVDDGVAVAGDHGVDAQAEEVLVVARQDARVHDRPKRVAGRCLWRQVAVDRLRRHDARGADLVGDVAGQVEHPGQDVLVVGHGQNRLQHELALPHHDGAVRAVVGVLPGDAGVLLVHADDVGHGVRRAARVGHHAVHVVDGAEAVAAQLQVVGHDAGARVAEVKGLLLVERVARVRVGDGHVAEAEPVEERAPVVVHVVQHHALALVEADLDVPLLPRHAPAHGAVRRHLERRALGLHHAQRLEVRARVRLRLRDVLARRRRLPRRQVVHGLHGGGVEARRQQVDAHHREGRAVHHRRDGQRERVVAAVRLRRIARIPHVQEALHHPHVVAEQPLAHAVRAVDPRVRHQHGARRQLQLGHGRAHARVRQHHLFNRQNLLAVAVGVLVRGQAHVALERARRQVGHGLVELVGVAQVVGDVHAAGNHRQGRRGRAGALGGQVGHELGLGRLL
ncbi:hypothetical protein SPBR_02543 [Sporothrix brasiliensis 5110]|uniref:Uncharacterized protein n=1 Tax=Sporothrix brasiliensis 5110 TaxID=1398154 RepID=A0A0C2J2A0_9PEZI|nr:uncharacterized protein SPBR_02543 [Sporothrix brasiliensis 5110]KIH93155.1 hypothetical protein SPBR_02543 [Sporothrix brasiliensis 5110]